MSRGNAIAAIRCCPVPPAGGLGSGTSSSQRRQEGGGCDPGEVFLAFSRIYVWTPYGICTQEGHQARLGPGKMGVSLRLEGTLILARSSRIAASCLRPQGSSKAGPPGAHT